MNILDHVCISVQFTIITVLIENRHNTTIVLNTVIPNTIIVNTSGPKKIPSTVHRPFSVALTWLDIIISHRMKCLRSHQRICNTLLGIFSVKKFDYHRLCSYDLFFKNGINNGHLKWLLTKKTKDECLFVLFNVWILTLSHVCAIYHPFASCSMSDVTDLYTNLHMCVTIKQHLTLVCGRNIQSMYKVHNLLCYKGSNH